MSSPCHSPFRLKVPFHQVKVARTKNLWAPRVSTLSGYLSVYRPQILSPVSIPLSKPPLKSTTLSSSSLIFPGSAYSGPHLSVPVLRLWVESSGLIAVCRPSTVTTLNVRSGGLKFIFLVSWPDFLPTLWCMKCMDPLTCRGPRVVIYVCCIVTTEKGDDFNNSSSKPFCTSYYRLSVNWTVLFHVITPTGLITVTLPPPFPVKRHPSSHPSSPPSIIFFTSEKEGLEVTLPSLFLPPL